MSSAESSESPSADVPTNPASAQDETSATQVSATQVSAEQVSAEQGPVRGSGNEAVERAAERSSETGLRNIPTLEGLPVSEDTANLRLGPDLNPALLALLPLVGVWRGEGEGNHPLTGDYLFGQEIVVSHDGGPYLIWTSRSWRLTEDGEADGPDLRETGYWRISEDDNIELLVAHAEGAIDLFYGRPLTQTSWNLTTDVSFTTATGTGGGGAKRLYGIVPDGDLAYVEERLDGDGDLVPRLSAKLTRHIG